VVEYAPLTVGEIRRLLARLTTPAHLYRRDYVLHWSHWRRHHQAIARQCHYQRRHKLHHETLLEY
jgi:hypothetical protein